MIGEDELSAVVLVFVTAIGLRQWGTTITLFLLWIPSQK